MYTILSTISFSIIELILVAILPLILIVTTIIYIALSKKSLQAINQDAAILKEHVNAADSFNISNTDVLANATDELQYEPLKNAISNVISTSEHKYDKRWLPDLSEDFNEEYLSSNQLKSSLQFTPAILVFSCGLLASFVLALLPVVNPSIFEARGIFSYIPLLIGIITALFMLNHRHILKKDLSLSINSMKDVIEKHIPVYTQKDGLALLVNQMTNHENQIHEDMNNFNQNVNEFVSDHFNKTVSDTIKTVLENDIAPPIKESSTALTGLASHLSEQQNTGMAELADRFSENLNESVKHHFQTLTGELNSFNVLMEDTTNFIQDSIAILENSRQQNILLNREVAESIELMTVAKNDMANEMAQISDFIEVLADVTQKMTSIYAGEDANLKDQIHGLEIALNNSLSTLSDGISQSKDSINISQQLHQEQNAHYNQMVDRMDALMNDLRTINGSIHSATDHFSTESTTKVDATLKGFENALADIVERLIFTTAEIKDAVEGLPLAIQSGKNLLDK